MRVQAMDYWHRAARRAIDRSAVSEAFAHASRGLQRLEALADSPERARQEPGLQLALGQALGKEASVFVSAISAWEIAVLIQKGRLILSMDVEEWLSHAASLPALRFLPVDRRTPQCRPSGSPGRFIRILLTESSVATARRLNLPLVTADEWIRNYQHVRSIW